jgi:outer membrane protein assembly factor BamD (BamD/ComL family)
LAEDRSKIEPAIQTLLTEFAPSEAQALGLHNIANTIGWKLFGYASGSARGQDVPALFDKCLQAIADYTQVTWPKSDWAMWAQRDLATLAIYRGDDAAADAAIGRLTTNYASSPDTPAALYFLGNYFLEANRDDKAQAVYKVLVEKFPTYDLAPLIKTALGQMRLRQGDDQGAEAIFQEVLATYAKHPRLAEAVNMMGMTYFDQALRTQGWEPGPVPNPPEPARIYMSNAVEKWHLIMDQMAEDPSATPTACSGMVQAYYRLADFEKALHYCREFLQRWPHHADARVVYIVTYKAAKRLMREGVIPEAEARALMQRAQDEIQGKTSSRPLTQEGGSGNGGMIQEQEATHE